MTKEVLHEGEKCKPIPFGAICNWQLAGKEASSNNLASTRRFEECLGTDVSEAEQEASRRWVDHPRSQQRRSPSPQMPASRRVGGNFPSPGARGTSDHSCPHQIHAKPPQPRRPGPSRRHARPDFPITISLALAATGLFNLALQWGSLGLLSGGYLGLGVFFCSARF